jgi:hypothetical protein
MQNLRVTLIIGVNLETLVTTISHSSSFFTNDNVDWNLLNEALLDDETSGHDGFSPTDQQEPNTPTSRDTIPKSTDRKFSG